MAAIGDQGGIFCRYLVPAAAKACVQPWSTLLAVARLAVQLDRHPVLPQLGGTRGKGEVKD